MNRLLGILALVAAMALPTIAQVQRMTSDDEAKFDGYYQRWQQDRQNNDRDDMVDMEHHMQDIMNTSMRSRRTRPTIRSLLKMEPIRHKIRIMTATMIAIAVTPTNGRTGSRLTIRTSSTRNMRNGRRRMPRMTAMA